MTLYQYRTLLVSEAVLKYGDRASGWAPEEVREWRKEHRFDKQHKKSRKARLKRVKKRMGR